MKKTKLRSVQKWLQPGIRVKRWLMLLAISLIILGIGFAQAYVIIFQDNRIPDVLYYPTFGFLPPIWRVGVAAIIGLCTLAIALYELNNSIVQPIVSNSTGSWVDILTKHNRLQKGLNVVAIGGGTGLPTVLRGMKTVTNNITAIVTMADDGGSSGRLRREFGVPPPGDLRNNIAALSDDEDMMTRLFQYRFAEGDLGGHSFGNLFLTALSEITGNMENAVTVAGRVLAITGRVIPSTLHTVNLVADVRDADGHLNRIHGESSITAAAGRIERIALEPSNAKALPEVIRAILSAKLIVIGPGSLYTSILPNLLVRGVIDALRVTDALVIYVCNIAQQPGETDGYTVAEHVSAIEKHAGDNIIDIIIANDTFPPLGQNSATQYVKPAPPDHSIYQQYRVVMADLTDPERPWRHNTQKLLSQLLKVSSEIEVEKGTSKSLGRIA